MNFQYIYIKALTVFMIIVLLGACSSNESHESNMDSSHNEHQSSDANEHGHGKHEESPEEGGIHLSGEQAKTIGLEFGEPTQIKMSDYVKATGMLGVPPIAYYSVSAKAQGIIRGCKTYVEGNPIKKGSLIAYLENPDFITKQQLYLEAKSELNYQKKELSRQRELMNANAGVDRNLQKAQSEVEKLKAKVKSLAKQLDYLGINSSQLSTENIVDKIAIYSPMSGFIRSINIHNGLFAQLQSPLMEIMSDKHLHLELEVFEKDISKIEIGQKISYSINALGGEQYEGEVSIIGKEFNSETKTMRVHGHLVGKRPRFLKNLFIDARIWLNDQTTEAIDEAAIISEGSQTFIFAGNKEKDHDDYVFKKLLVEAGASVNKYTSIKILDRIPDGMSIVTQGAYYVYAQSKAGELEHEH